jgi:hypothetical protein
MSPDDDPRPTPPERPADEACCGRGCPHCVYDVYDQAMTRYEERLREWKARHPEARDDPQRIDS